MLQYEGRRGGFSALLRRHRKLAFNEQSLVVMFIQLGLMSEGFLFDVDSFIGYVNQYGIDF